ncbi:uncharacterized protein N0V89_008663 [Didymosphaeria variabile]|uniref:Uncharacterized protein n=1 Tax=Didymosphaeria variabile TaxID=1932322 RepID=A0A9W8XHZ8_9PLEO|nr:uncharacterized protein N0V89_008663 [Didymosphaeria variabile]KAJ4350042.1 hypothetical protein N0V89_008663 [Didymosphaeria variabile]
MEGARFRALDINSAGQPASPALSTLVLPTPAVVRPLTLQASVVGDAKMDGYDKENATREIVRSDTPVVLETEGKHQSRSPAKSSTQIETRQSTPTRMFPLGPAAAPKNPRKNSQSHNGFHATNRPSINSPRSRPSKRPSSPLKRTPAPGKNERFETTPTGFRYTIELPESKIVPKKDSGTTPSKSKTSTPVKGFARMDSTSKTNSPERAISPSKSRSISPRKELLQTRAASPEKKSVGTGVDQAEPTPKAHKKRDSVKLTKTNCVHAGTPTVEVTKGDMWTGVQFRSPFTSETSSSVEMQVKETEASEGERRLGMNGVSSSPVSMESQEKSTPIKEKASVPSRKQSIPTNFGEMLRNSSQNLLHTRSSLFDEVPDKKQSTSPTILEKARRKSEIVTESLLGVIAKPNFHGDSLTEDVVAPVVKDFANEANDRTNKVVMEEARTRVHKSQTDRRVSFANTPRTPTGTPPALIAAMEADMDGIRNSLRRSLGDGDAAAPRGPDLTRWLGSSTNDKSKSLPDLSLSTDATNVGNTPRRSLHERMAAAKQNILSRSSSRSKKTAPSPLPLRTVSKTERKEHFHSRLPRLSPTKPKTQLRVPGTIPQAPRTSPFEVAKAAPLTPSRVPAMASHRARYTRETQDRGENVGFASSEDIAKQVEEWNSISQQPETKPAVRAPQPKSVAKTPIKTTARVTTTPRSNPTFMSPTATSNAKLEKRKETKSYTPPGSPATPGMLPRSPRQAHLFASKPTPSPAKKKLSPLKNPKIRALTAAAPRTPLPRNKGDVRGMNRGALRTPSKEMGNKLDAEIDAHLEREALAGRVFTPSGQRISDLLARRRKSGELRSGEDANKVVNPKGTG